MGPYFGEGVNFYKFEKRFKIHLARNAETCVEASSGVNSSLFKSLFSLGSVGPLFGVKF